MSDDPRNQVSGPVDPLFPYQRVGAQFLASRRLACLYDEQGVGKSAQAVRASDIVKARSVLVICRAVAVENWKNEFKKWSQTNPHLTVSSYESLHKVFSGPGPKQSHSIGIQPPRAPPIDVALFDVVIVDEAHYLKEPSAKRTRAVLGKGGAIHHAKFAWLLTGTPTPNHAGELWTTLYTFGRVQSGYESFTDYFCHVRETAFGRQITGTNRDRMGELRRLAAPICLRRTKEQVLTELPPIFYQDLVVQPGPVEIGYARTFAKYFLQAGGGVEALTKDLETELGVMHGIVGGKVFTMEAVKALEAASKSIMTLRRYSGLQKIKPVYDLVTDELDNNAYSKLVIFGVHRDTVEILRDKLAKKYGAVLIYGGSKPEVIEQRVNRFQKDPACRVFIGNIQSAGTSITLTAANQVLFIEQSFVPGDMAQAAMRCHRIGQTKPVTVRFVGLANSIDQYIAEIIRRKTSEICAMMDGFGDSAGEGLKGVANADNVAASDGSNQTLTPEIEAVKLADLL